MLDLKKLLGQVIDVNKKYQNDADVYSAENLLSRYQSFKIRVPVIGHFSTGKSYLLNSLLDFNEKHPLLPCDATRETAFPAEVTYTSEASYAQYFVDNEQKPAGSMDIKDFREKNYRDKLSRNSVKPTRVQLFLNTAQLVDIPKVSLIDMPGFESGIEAHNEALDQNLPDSSAFILTFSAHAPALTETMDNILRELVRSRKPFPLLVVLTHCDEMSEKDSVDCAVALEKSLKRVFPFDFVVALTGKGMENTCRPIRDFLLDLQNRETNFGEFLYAKFEAPVLALADSTLAYLQGQLKALELKETDNQEAKKKFQTQIDNIHAVLEQEKKNLKKSIPQCADNVVGDVGRMLCGNLSAYTDKVFSSRGREDEIAAFQQRMNSDIRQTIQESFTRNFENNVQEYYQSVDKELVSLRCAFWGSEGQKESVYSKVAKVGVASVAMALGGDLVLSSICGVAVTTIGATIAASLSASLIPIVGWIISGGALLKLVSDLIRSKKEEKKKIRVKLESEIYPEILDQLRIKLREKMDDMIEHIAKTAQMEAERQINALKKAAADAEALQKAEKNEQEEKKKILQKEICMMQETINECC